MSDVPTSRLIVFLALVVFMALLPALPHVFGVRTPVIRSWRMFHGYGNDVCAVEFFTVSGGEETPIDRCVALGYDGCDEAPPAVRRLNDREAVLAQARNICRKLGGDTDLRGRARCGSDRGWQTRLTGEQNLCTLPAKTPVGKVKALESLEKPEPAGEVIR